MGSIATKGLLLLFAMISCLLNQLLPEENLLVMLLKDFLIQAQSPICSFQMSYGISASG